MGWFNTPRNETASPDKRISHIQQIETMNTRLEKARAVVAAGRVFPGLNRKDHYVVFAPQENGFYIVNAEGCCTDGQRRVDLLGGYCEHRLAVDLFNEAQDAKGQPSGDLIKVEATTDSGDTPPLTRPVVIGQNGKTNVAP